MNRSLCNRADLLRVLSGNERLLPATARLLGFDLPPELIQTSSDAREFGGGPTPIAGGPLLIGEKPASTPTKPVSEPIELKWRAKPTAKPEWHPIEAWPALLPRLRAELLGNLSSKRVDVPETVRLLSRGGLVDNFPRMKFKRWGERVQVILDRSQHLTPFWQDQQFFVRHLRQLLPGNAVQLAVYDQSLGSLRLIDNGRTGPYQLPPPHVPVIALTDFGALLSRPSVATLQWLSWANDLQDHEAVAIGIVPCNVARILPSLRTSLRLLSWQPQNHYENLVDQVARKKIVDQLFELLNFVSRLEPGLLRAVRRLLPDATDASLESEFWQDARLSSRHHRAATLDKQEVDDQRASELRADGLDVRQRAVQLVRQWRGSLDDAVWVAEMWKLNVELRDTLPESDQQDADRWLDELVLRTTTGRDTDLALLAWLARATDSRWIPPGEFQMGSSEGVGYEDERPRHRVRLTSGYWMFDTPVTQELWQAVTGTNPSHFKGVRRPVESVSWNECQQFFAEFNEQLSGISFGFPTEAQWEYACRAGTTTAYSWGDQITSGNARYWSDDAQTDTVDVACYDANPWGLYDMHGNVWEWCYDGPRDYLEDQVTDPLGPTDPAERVLRGGGWNLDAGDLRSAYRDAGHPEYRYHSIGFRPASVQQAASRRPSESSEGPGMSTEETPDRSD